ncbi:MAG: radical SAM protein [Candidatus Omnitrophota bacterium]
MKKVILYNPPGGLWLRGEGRCEQDLDNATAYTVTAPTSLCYMAAILRNKGIEPKIIDCPVEKIDFEAFKNVISNFNPDMAILNASVLNLINDLEVINTIHKIYPNIINCAILPYFNSIPLDKISKSLFQCVDIIITGEMEAVVNDLADYINNIIKQEQIRGIILNDRVSGKIIKNALIPPVDNLDLLPCPARDLVHNELYLRPDIGKPMASIVDGKGCPCSCIYCLAPITTGRKVRKRSVDSVINEIRHCIQQYNIYNFLFRSDTFTIDKNWVLEFCRKITDLNLRIYWAANSRTDTFDEELAFAMKRAGCFLIEFGIESGSDASLKLEKKGTTINNAMNAVVAAKKAKLLVYGTVLIGFPWENLNSLRETEKFIHKLNIDFVEAHIVAPYRGTELFEMLERENLIDNDIIGHDMIKNPAIKGTRYLSREQLLNFRKEFLRRFYMRPDYFLKTLLRMRSLSEVIQYGKHGLRILRNQLN